MGEGKGKRWRKEIDLMKGRREESGREKDTQNMSESEPKAGCDDQRTDGRDDGWTHPLGQSLR